MRLFVLFTFLLSSGALAGEAAVESCPLNFDRLGKGDATEDKLPPEVKQAPSDELKGTVYVSTNNVERLRDSGKADPRLLPYYSSGGPLGYGGTVGPWSPANQLGPVGDNPWNPSVYVSATDRTKDVAKLPDALKPTGPNGVLGTKSAVADKTYRELLTKLPNGKSLEEGGSLMVIGPKGVLGPYSSIGALGPAGATGLARDPKTGAFLMNGKVITEIPVAGANGATSSVPLVELYQQNYAASLSRAGKLDDSFIVDGLASQGKSLSYVVNVKKDTWVNFLASPQAIGDRFQIELLTKDGQVFAKADSKDLVNFVSARFASDAQVRVRVTNLGASPYNVTPFVPWMSETNTFRLHVITAPADATLAVDKLQGGALTVLQ